VGAETRDAGREPSGRSRRSARLPHPSSIRPKTVRRSTRRSAESRDRFKSCALSPESVAITWKPVGGVAHLRSDEPAQHGSMAAGSAELTSATSSKRCVVTDRLSHFPDRSESATATLVFAPCRHRPVAMWSSCGPPRGFQSPRRAGRPCQNSTGLGHKQVVRSEYRCEPMLASGHTTPG